MSQSTLHPAAQTGPNVSDWVSWSLAIWTTAFFLISGALWAQPAGGGFGAGGPTATGVVTLEASQVPYTVTVPGRAVAYEEVNIRPRVGGIIDEIVYEPGAKVEAGAVLFRIESATYEATVASAVAEVARAEAALEKSRSTLSRYESLEGTGITTEEVETARVSVFQAEAELSAAQASLQVARLDLERTEIKSPISGIVDIPSVSLGTLVTANQTDALTTVTRLDPIYVDIQESSRRIADIRDRVAAGSLTPGESLDIRLRLENGVSYDGQGTMVAPSTTVSSTTGTLSIRMQFDNPDRMVIPGQFLRVDVILGTIDAVLVPQGVTSRASTGELTAFIAVDGVAEERVLEEQGSYENAWIVTSGVEAGESLIVDGLRNLRAGAEVAPVPVTISANGVVTEVEAAPEASADNGPDAAPEEPPSPDSAEGDAATDEG